MENQVNSHASVTISSDSGRRVRSPTARPASHTTYRRWPPPIGLRCDRAPPRGASWTAAGARSGTLRA